MPIIIKPTITDRLLELTNMLERIAVSMDKLTHQVKQTNITLDQIREQIVEGDIAISKE